MSTAAEVELTSLEGAVDVSNVLAGEVVDAEHGLKGRDVRSMQVLPDPCEALQCVVNAVLVARIDELVQSSVPLRDENVLGRVVCKSNCKEIIKLDVTSVSVCTYTESTC